MHQKQPPANVAFKSILSIFSLPSHQPNASVYALVRDRFHRAQAYVSHNPTAKQHSSGRSSRHDIREIRNQKNQGARNPAHLTLIWSPAYQSGAWVRRDKPAPHHLPPAHTPRFRIHYTGISHRLSAHLPQDRLSFPRHFFSPLETMIKRIVFIYFGSSRNMRNVSGEIETAPNPDCFIQKFPNKYHFLSQLFQDLFRNLSFRTYLIISYANFDRKDRSLPKKFQEIS